VLAGQGGIYEQEHQACLRHRSGGLATLAMTGVQAADAVTVSGRTGSPVRHTMIGVSDPRGMSRSAPRCSSAVGKGPILSTVHTAMKKVPGAPFGDCCDA
jgi:hypothetical protein